MPNWVYSGFRVTGDPEEVSRFRRMMFRTVTAAEASAAGQLRGTTLILDFGGIIPMPPEAKSNSSEAWSIRNWGTKWNALDLQIRREEDGFLHFQFTTPWDFPTPVFEALEEEFPGLIFEGSAYEENDGFELKGQFNGDRSWGPGKIEWLIIPPIEEEGND